MKYSYLDADILEIYSLNRSLNYSQIAERLAAKYPDQDIRTEVLRKHVSKLLNTELITTKQVLDKNGKVLKEVKSLRTSEIKEVPAGFVPKKIVSLGHGAQNITYEPEKTNDFKLILESIERLSNRFKSLDTYKIPKVNNDNKLTLCIYTSDKHIGSTQDSNDLYPNVHTHKEKMYSVFAEVLKLSSIYGTFEKLYYFDLGDALDGFNKKTTRGGHELEQSLNNREQFDTLVSSEIEFINSLIKNQIANDYKIIATTNDNHSGDFSYFAFRLIFEYLKQVYNIETFINTQFLNFEKIGRHHIIYTHGKDIKYKKHGLPLNLDNKTEIFIKEFIMNQGLKYSRLIKGDLHQSSFNRGKWFDYINVASLIANTSYTTTNFGDNKAGFYIEIFDSRSEGYLSSHLTL